MDRVQSTQSRVDAAIHINGDDATDFSRFNELDKLRSELGTWKKVNRAVWLVDNALMGIVAGIRAEIIFRDPTWMGAPPLHRPTNIVSGLGTFFVLFFVSTASLVNTLLSTVMRFRNIKAEEEAFRLEQLFDLRAALESYLENSSGPDIELSTHIANFMERYNSALNDETALENYFVRNYCKGWSNFLDPSFTAENHVEKENKKAAKYLGIYLHTRRRELAVHYYIKKYAQDKQGVLDNSSLKLALSKYLDERSTTKQKTIALLDILEIYKRLKREGKTNVNLDVALDFFQQKSVSAKRQAHALKNFLAVCPNEPSTAFTNLRGQAAISLEEEKAALENIIRICQQRSAVKTVESKAFTEDSESGSKVEDLNRYLHEGLKYSVDGLWSEGVRHQRKLDRTNQRSKAAAAAVQMLKNISYAFLDITQKYVRNPNDFQTYSDKLPQVEQELSQCEIRLEECEQALMLCEGKLMLEGKESLEDKAKALYSKQDLLRGELNFLQNRLKLLPSERNTLAVSAVKMYSKFLAEQESVAVLEAFFDKSQDSLVRFNSNSTKVLRGNYKLIRAINDYLNQCNFYQHVIQFCLITAKSGFDNVPIDKAIEVFKAAYLNPNITPSEQGSVLANLMMVYTAEAGKDDRLNSGNYAQLADAAKIWKQYGTVNEKTKAAALARVTESYQQEKTRGRSDWRLDRLMHIQKKEQAGIYAVKPAHPELKLVPQIVYDIEQSKKKQSKLTKLVLKINGWMAGLTAALTTFSILGLVGIIAMFAATAGIGAILGVLVGFYVLFAATLAGFYILENKAHNANLDVHLAIGSEIERLREKSGEAEQELKDKGSKASAELHEKKDYYKKEIKCKELELKRNALDIGIRYLTKVSLIATAAFVTTLFFMGFLFPPAALLVTGLIAGAVGVACLLGYGGLEYGKHRLTKKIAKIKDTQPLAPESEKARILEAANLNYSPASSPSPPTSPGVQQEKGVVGNKMIAHETKSAESKQSTAGATSEILPTEATSSFLDSTGQTLRRITSGSSSSLLDVERQDFQPIEAANKDEFVSRTNVSSV